MIMHHKHAVLLGLTFSLTLTACGGGGGGDDYNGAPDPVEASTGVLLDSPVINISYSTATGSRSGTTNSAGEFSYVSGDTLTFAIGDLKFPSVTAAQLITPLNMAGTS